MITITKKDFEILHKNTLNGCLIFLNGESCALCQTFYDQLKDIRSITSNWIVVLISDETSDWFLSQHSITGTPCTRIYYNGLIIFEKNGLLFDKQYNDILLTLDEYGMK